MKHILVLLITLNIAGCAVKTVDKKNENYQDSMPLCDAHGGEIDCDWDNVPDTRIAMPSV